MRSVSQWSSCMPLWLPSLMFRQKVPLGASASACSEMMPTASTCRQPCQKGFFHKKGPPKSEGPRTASRHRSRNTSAPSQKHSRAKVPEPFAMHALSAKSYRLDDSRGQRLKLACDKLIIDKNEHVFVYMVRYMPAGAISFDIVLAGSF